MKKKNEAFDLTSAKNAEPVRRFRCLSACDVILCLAELLVLFTLFAWRHVAVVVMTTHTGAGR